MVSTADGAFSLVAEDGSTPGELALSTVSGETGLYFSTYGSNKCAITSTAMRAYSNITLGVTASAQRFGAAYLGGNTVSAPAAPIDVAQTWNAGGQTFEAMVCDITDTASAADSSLINLKVGGTPKFRVGKDGDAQFYNAYTDASNYERLRINYDSINNVFAIRPENDGTGQTRRLALCGQGGLELETQPGVTSVVLLTGNFSPKLDMDLGRTVDRWNQLFLGGDTETNSAPMIDGEQTWNDGADTFEAMVFDITDTASAADSALMNLKVGGASKFRVGKDGSIACYNAYTDASNYERLRMWYDASATSFRIGVQEVGTGADRDLIIASSNHNSTQITLSTDESPAASNSVAVIRGSRVRSVDEGIDISNFGCISGYADGSNVAIGGRGKTGGSGASGSVVLFGGDHVTAGQTPGDVWITPGKNSGDDVYGCIYIGAATGNKIGFYGVTPIAQAVLATGASATVDDVITFFADDWTMQAELTFTLTEQQANQLVGLMDAAVKAGGLQAALVAVPLYIEMQRQSQEREVDPPSDE